MVTRWNSTISRLLAQKQAVLAVLLESMKPSARSVMHYTTEISQTEFACSVLELLAQATTMLCSEKLPSISLVQLMLAALLKRYLKPSELDAKIVADIKAAVNYSRYQKPIWRLKSDNVDARS